MITDGTYVRSRPPRLTRARPPRSLALGATAILHVWKRNAMVSIFGGTLLYMALSRLPY